MIGHKNNRTKGTNNAPIPEDNGQYCFRMPLKLEVHKRYWTTLRMSHAIIVAKIVPSNSPLRFPDLFSMASENPPELTQKHTNTSTYALALMSSENQFEKL